MKNENMKRVTEYVQAVVLCANQRIAKDGGVLYIMGRKHRYLWYANWMWNLHDADEMWELFTDHEFCRKPSWVPKALLLTAVRDSLGSPIPEQSLPAPISRRCGSTIAEYRGDLQQYLMNIYYPMNEDDAHDH